MDPADLDDTLDRALRALPPPRAPRSLVPRVMAATRVARPPAATGWFTWPLAWRLVSVALLCGLAAGAWLLLATPPANVQATARTAGEAATVIRVLWEVLLQPVATYMFLLGVSLAVACAAAWAALEFALGGAAHQ